MVDGSDQSALLMLASTPPAPPTIHGDEGLLATSPGAGPRLLIKIHRKFRVLGFLPYYLWIFLLIAALGYALAVYLGRPLRSLKRTVEQFGRGDLSARTHSTRRDEIGELARAFDLMAARTETLMTAERRLLQDVSHELRTPVSRLRLTVRLAQTSEKPEAALERIKKETDRLADLLDELLQVTAAEEDPHCREQEHVRLDALLKHLVDDGMMEAEAKGCRIALLANESAVIIGDEELLRRAIENVLRNAIRHAPDGTVVDVELQRHNGTATIQIRDFGTGVPDDSLAWIFQPFYRVDADRSRLHGGVGLGLSITQRAIALHGGQIRATNAAPGLRVTIDLPQSN
jgi:two-component system sensor histidine kinase CpxA